jgi:hypothetical protein
MYFQSSSWALVAALFVIVGGAVAVGYLAGRYIRSRPDTHMEPAAAGP